MENFQQAIGLRINENKEVYEGEARTKQLKVDPTIYDALIKEKVAVGDVIHLEANSGAMKRVGRSDTFATEFDLEAEEGTDMTSPHGTPVDLLELVIICTETYGPAETIQILAIRAQVEELVVDEESLAYLGEIGQQASLRPISRKSVLYIWMPNLPQGFFKSSRIDTSHNELDLILPMHDCVFENSS
ncbi:hypothetical protein F0562_002090 [Nyssa sinensis]|uniref:RuvB-like helicase n=1 Tax=Nyssa sinensis TaxID=561372 RepID=A0A5J5C618_9ASTE|nr:hypothetical protein F0562_002090 [Nyssa sinensis]